MTVSENRPGFSGEGEAEPFPLWAGSSTGIIIRIAFALLGTLLGLFLMAIAFYVRLAAMVLTDLLEIPDRSATAVVLFVLFGVFVIGSTLTAAVRPNRLTVTLGGFGFVAGVVIVIWLLLG